MRQRCLQDRYSLEMTRKRTTFSIILGFLIITAGCRTGYPDPLGKEEIRTKTTDDLIELLLEIDQQTFGLHGTAFQSTFLAEDKPMKLSGGVFGSQAPKEYPQMRELVRRGVEALPALLAHLSDARPTRLLIGTGDFRFMFKQFATEYDSRTRTKQDQMTLEITLDGSNNIDLPYTVTLGDVCYALVGQIVGRKLLPVRYQPTGGLIVNSPVHSPILAERTRRDWRGITADELKEVWIQDLRRNNHVWMTGPAIQRLRFYFPATFEELQKQNTFRKKIKAYLAYEKEY